MAKMRTGVIPITIEIGCYKRPLLQNREYAIFVCFERETEEHVITRCSQYNDITNLICHAALNIGTNFMF